MYSASSSFSVQLHSRTLERQRILILVLRGFPRESRAVWPCPFGTSQDDPTSIATQFPCSLPRPFSLIISRSIIFKFECAFFVLGTAQLVQEQGSFCTQCSSTFSHVLREFRGYSAGGCSQETTQSKTPNSSPLSCLWRPLETRCENIFSKRCHICCPPSAEHVLVVEGDSCSRSAHASRNQTRDSARHSGVDLSCFANVFGGMPLPMRFSLHS